MDNVTATALLGREPFTPDDALLDSFSGQTILVSGAGGTIGSALVSALATLPCHIVAYDRSETNLTRLLSDSHNDAWKACLTPFLGDINQPSLLDYAFRTHRPGLVIHAAAYKHLPLLETFPLQAVENNVIGTRNVLQAAIRQKVGKFVLVSTDKSVNPSSVMGSTKRLAEMVTLNRHANPDSLTGIQSAVTRPIVVRLGNVLGSSGSVLPLFESQIAAGGPITVTHPDATRFFMSIPEAANLILIAAAIGTGQETFVLDMGHPVNIAAMAKRLVTIRGRSDIEIKFTGMRPGEKLTEQLYTGDTAPTAHPRIWRVANSIDTALMTREWPYLIQALQKCNADYVLRCLRALVPEYTQAHMTEANLHA
jgi:FlaA1/EpsC-like NDP-sugar epimerase